MKSKSTNCRQLIVISFISQPIIDISNDATIIRICQKEVNG